jgi:integrase
MFHLGERAGKVLRRPFIDMLQEHNARTGFFERADVDSVLARLPADLKAVFAVAYVTGWRVKSEILTRQWAHVDFQSGWLRRAERMAAPGETKNLEAASFRSRLSYASCWNVRPRAALAILPMEQGENLLLYGKLHPAGPSLPWSPRADVLRTD